MKKTCNNTIDMRLTYAIIIIIFLILYIEYYYEACLNRVPLAFRTKMFLSSRHIGGKFNGQCKQDPL